ncbi:MAG: hypothetical protein QF473_15700 [Planctomycetota bacterium]|nr:hypothetical protein [Planctomycetota bacterium]
MTNLDVPRHVPRSSEAWQTCLGACLMLGLLLPANAEKVLSFQEAYKAKKAAVIEKYTSKGICGHPRDAFLLLREGKGVEEANAFLDGKARKLSERSLDAWVYYLILAQNSPHLSELARQNLVRLVDKSYGAKLPSYVSLKRKYDPWNYLLTATPTENHLLNDTANRLAETIVFPDRVYSDGHRASEYRIYWEDAFRRFVASRVKHGMREWRSTVYCHIPFNSALLVYHIMPDGPTRNAAKMLLDYMFLSIAVAYRNTLWTGPHSRVYNGRHANILDHSTQVYRHFSFNLHSGHIIPEIAASDYIPPEAIANLPKVKEKYASIEKVGPRYHPPGQGAGIFNPDRYNPYLCKNDREDAGGDGILYNYLTPRYALGSMQDWGWYGGEFHMHCIPWCFQIATGSYTDTVFSFAGSETEAKAGYNQGGYMTWPNEHNDQDATIFQYKTVLFSQMRAHFHAEKVIHKKGPFPEAPWTRQQYRILGFKREKTLLKTRFYIANSIGKPVLEKGWAFGEKDGVCFAIRSVRGDFRPELQSSWVKGRVYFCDEWDDVILMEVGEVNDYGTFERFRQKVIKAKLDWDGYRVLYQSTKGDEITFAWKENAAPTVNGKTPEYGGRRFNDPFVKSEYQSGVITVECGGAKVTLDASNPERMSRTEGLSD